MTLSVRKIDIAGFDLPPGFAAVVADFYAGFFGGPLSQLLRCLAAVKVCEELKNNGIDAAPVCLVHRAPHGFSTREINLVDRHSKFYCLHSTEEIEKIFPDGDKESLSALKEIFARDTNSVSSCASWLKYLLEGFNALVVERREVVPDQNSKSHEPVDTLPVAVFVMDSVENFNFNFKKISFCKHESALSPLAWPAPYVTISSARHLKILKRYGLDPERLFDGKERTMNYVLETLNSDVPDRLQKLLDETCIVFNELYAGAFAAHGERSGRGRKTRAARIIYQLEKIQRHSRAALNNRKKAAENRIGRACDFLAPLGRRQQDVLGGAQIPLFYGRAGVRALYENLDITTPNHQLIEID